MSFTFDRNGFVIKYVSLTETSKMGDCVMKKQIAILLTVALTLGACSASEPATTTNRSESTATEESNTAQTEDAVVEAEKPEEKESGQEWKEAYREVLSDWSFIEPEQEYLQMYFGDEGYNYNEYFLYDLNQDGTPELFLHSNDMDVADEAPQSNMMGLTSVFTWDGKEVRYLGYDDIEGINEQTGEIIVFGHWHGAGGSGIYEYSFYRISDDLSTLEQVAYIDYMNYLSSKPDEEYYVISSEETDGYQEFDTDDPTYDNLFEEHVKPMQYFHTFKRYALSDETGLDEISTPFSAGEMEAFLLPVTAWDDLEEQELSSALAEELERFLADTPSEIRHLADGGYEATYDCRKASAGHFNVIEPVVTNLWYMNPVESFTEDTDMEWVDDDPRGIYEQFMIFRYPEDVITLFATEAYNCDKMWTDRYKTWEVWDDTNEAISYYLEDGYFYKLLWGLGGGGETLVQIESVRTDGEYCYVTYRPYHESMSPDDIESPSYAIVKYKETNGGHWSLYYYEHYQPPLFINT